MNSYQNNGYQGNTCSDSCAQHNAGGCVRSENAYYARNANCANGGSCARSRCVCGFCSLKAAALFAILLALALGLILGTVYAETLFPALAALIVFAVIMAVAVIALLIYRGCEC